MLLIVICLSLLEFLIIFLLFSFYVIRDLVGTISCDRSFGIMKVLAKSLFKFASGFSSTWPLARLIILFFVMVDLVYSVHYHNLVHTCVTKTRKFVVISDNVFNE